MPVYFVDLSDGETETRDDVGTEMSGPEVARSEVMRMLAETARFGVGRGNELSLVATVRDASKQEVYRIRLTLECSPFREDLSHNNVEVSVCDPKLSRARQVVIGLNRTPHLKEHNIRCHVDNAKLEPR